MELTRVVRESWACIAGLGLAAAMHITYEKTALIGHTALASFGVSLIAISLFFAGAALSIISHYHSRKEHVPQLKKKAIIVIAALIVIGYAMLGYACFVGRE